MASRSLSMQWPLLTLVGLACLWWLRASVERIDAPPEADEPPTASAPPTGHDVVLALEHRSLDACTNGPVCSVASHWVVRLEVLRMPGREHAREPSEFRSDDREGLQDALRPIVAAFPRVRDTPHVQVGFVVRVPADAPWSLVQPLYLAVGMAGAYRIDLAVVDVRDATTRWRETPLLIDVGKGALGVDLLVTVVRDPATGRSVMRVGEFIEPWPTFDEHPRAPPVIVEGWDKEHVFDCDADGERTFVLVAEQWRHAARQNVEGAVACAIAGGDGVPVQAIAHCIDLLHTAGFEEIHFQM